MNEIQRGIATLLRCAVTREQLPLPEGFTMAAAFPLIRQHHMASLAYAGAVCCGVSQQDPVMQKLFQAYGKCILIDARQMRDLNKVFRAFDENGIDYMPLKGCRMKQLYPSPELRIMGDGDVLIRMEQYSQIPPLMRSLGFTEDQESDHEIDWKTPGLFLELHKRLIPSYNKDFYAYYGEGWDFAKVKDGTRYSMTADDEMVYLFTHFAKHFRDGGIGCRHLVDLWVYRRANPHLDETYIRGELDKLQLGEFYENICSLITVWFADGTDNEMTDFLTEFIFRSGSWGKMESRIISVAVRDAGQKMRASEGKLSYALRILFPPAYTLKKKYPILAKAPWVLPGVWLVRPFCKVLFDRDSLKRHQEKMDLMTEENLETRKQLLEYVGLEYNF